MVFFLIKKKCFTIYFIYLSGREENPIHRFTLQIPARANDWLCRKVKPGFQSWHSMWVTGIQLLEPPQLFPRMHNSKKLEHGGEQPNRPCPPPLRQTSNLKRAVLTSLAVKC